MKSSKSNKVTVTQIHGHRGARGLFPENSLVAIEKALEIGCDAIEVDVCVTKDNILVALHDPILNPDIVRDPNGNWINSEISIRELTVEQAKKFDIGRLKPNTEYSKRFARQQPVDNTHIPTLTEVVELIQEVSPGTLLNIELKSTGNNFHLTPESKHYVDLVAGFLTDHDIIGQSFIQSFDWRLPLQLSQTLPDLKTGLLTDQQATAAPPIFSTDSYLEFTNGLKLSDFQNIVYMIKETGSDIWSCNYRDLTPELMNDAIDLDLEVYVWTVNQPAAMHEMLDFGVHAITTDYPNRLFKILEVEF